MGRNALNGLYWVAGYLAGEGHFRVRTDGGGSGVEVFSTHPATLQVLKDLAGGTVRPKKVRSERGHRDGWAWSIYGPAAAALCERLLALPRFDGVHPLANKYREVEALALYRKYPAGTALGDSIRARARAQRWAEYREANIR